MKFTVTMPVEIEIEYIRLDLPVRYGTDNIPADFPLRNGGIWTATVHLATGQILGWPGGAGSVEMKVCDEGNYYLLDGDKEEVAKIEQNYVPHGVVPGEYGDYVGLQINAQGVITNWPKRPSVSAFFREER